MLDSLMFPYTTLEKIVVLFTGLITGGAFGIFWCFYSRASHSLEIGPKIIIIAGSIAAGCVIGLIVLYVTKMSRNNKL